MFFLSGGSLTCQYFEGESTTPPPGVCKFEDELRLSGEIFMSKTEGCSRCWCIDGAIRCKVSIFPSKKMDGNRQFN